MSPSNAIPAAGSAVLTGDARTTAIHATYQQLGQRASGVFTDVDRYLTDGDRLALIDARDAVTLMLTDIDALSQLGPL